ncbi:MAG: LysR family transcriptional regulator [Peptococcaceae bacterium]|jgi:DNA-binding transcriptional LysR family regulator|nr:LysR family transcriptional regulator [Peptococcaceae bacterium]
MNERDWEILKVIVQERSAAKAAERLFMSQPAISYRMSLMEQEMNCKLFVRNNKGVSLTSAGDRLFSFTDKMLRQFVDIRDHVRNKDGVLSGTIRFGVPSAFAERHMPAILHGFRVKYPAVSIELSVGISNEVMRRMYLNEILAAIVRGNHQWSENSIHLYNEPIEIIAPFAFQTIDGLKHFPYISYRADPVLQYQIDRWLHENFSVPPAPAVNTDSVQACVNLVQEGLGWTLVTSTRVFNNEKIFKTTARDSAGIPYLRPSYLIYANAVAEYDIYMVFIHYIQNWISQSGLRQA